MVIELMDSGSLGELVAAGGVQSEAVLLHVTYQSLLALEHMHAMHTIHRDVKPDNILISHRADVKVADLGLALTLEHTAGDGRGRSESATDQSGTTAYLSPERILGQEYSYAADVWALGMSIMALGKY
jgi:serine/threonine protein kinase